MRRPALRLLPAALALALVAADASAAGLLVPRDGTAPIRVRSHRVSATVEDGLARTTLRQTFVNPTDRVLEAVYVFPLPEGAALVDVAMETGGQRLEGLLVERKRARRVYNDIVRRERDPALVEQIGRSTFRLSVYPVLPEKETVVELSWIQHVPLRGGAFRYVYPLALWSDATTTEHDLTVTVEVRSSAPLGVVTASLPDMEVVKKGPHEAVASFEKVKATLDRDIAVEGKVEVGEATLSVSTWRGEKGDGYFLAVVTPPPARDEDVIPRDVILVLDTSGSMLGVKMEQARASALYLLDGLRASDRVNVLAFSSAVKPFAAAPVPATEENLAKLREFVAGLGATGGTALGEALRVALDVPEAPGRVRTVVLLTDGRPTIGETKSAKLIEVAKKGTEKGLRIFPFGVGQDVDSGLLRGFARVGRGTAEIFRPGGEIGTRLSAFLDRTSSPVLGDVRLEVAGLTTYDVYPRPLPDAYLGEQVVVVGRYSGGGEREVTASAVRGGKRAKLVATADFRRKPGGATVAKDLFGRMKLSFLEEELQLRTGLADDAYFAALTSGAYSNRGEVVEEIVAVSMAHRVQCAFTSFLVLLPEDRARLDPRDLDSLARGVDRAREARREAAGGEPPNDLPFEETIGDKGLGDGDFISDAPFDGPDTSAAIGIGGGAGGSLGGRGGHRNLRAHGGGRMTEHAVDLGLEWLKNHQDPDGSWDAGGKGKATNDPAVTGLTLLAFLGAGETHKHGRHKNIVKSGLKYLKQIQDPEGCFGPRSSPHFLEGHAIAATAMSEAYALTGSPLFKLSAQSGIDFLVKAKSRPFWEAMALRSARAAGLRVAREALDDARARLWVAPTSRPGFPPATPEAISAASVLCRILLGEDPRKSELLLKAAESVAEGHDRLDSLDHSALYFGTLALFQVGGPSWKRWNEGMKAAVLDRRRKDGDEKGSWDPVGADGKALGRVGTTALMTMCLEVYYRYARVFGTR